MSHLNCNCYTPVVSNGPGGPGIPTPPPTPTCPDCLRLMNLMLAGEQTPEPCNEAFEVDAKYRAYLDPCANHMSWEIVEHSAGLTDVAIDAEGMISARTATTSYPENGLWIEYRVKCTNNSFAQRARLLIFPKRHCANLKAKNVVCNHCDGTLTQAAPINNTSIVKLNCEAASGGTIDLKTAITGTAFGGTPVFTLKQAQQSFFESASLSQDGILTFEKAVAVGGRGRITYTAQRLGYKLEGEVIVEAVDICKDVACPDGEACNPCNGLCEEVQGDLQVGP